MRDALRRLFGGRSRDLDRRALRAVFLHLPKTAGQSVRRVLAKRPFVLSDVKQATLGWSDDFTYRRFADEGFARVIRAELGPEIWDRCFTFTFARNPWDRAVSAWRYLDVPGGPGAGLTFPEFVDRVTSTAEPRYSATDHALNKFSWHVEPQWPQLVGPAGELLVDFVGRVERLQADFDEACRRIGIPAVELPHVNATDRDGYEGYFDAGTRARIGEHYAMDVEKLGYEF